MPRKIDPGQFWFPPLPPRWVRRWRPLVWIDVLRHQLEETDIDKPRNRSDWLAQGYDDVREARWLLRGQALIMTDNVLYVAIGMVLPDSWEVWPFVPGGPWTVGWTGQARPSVYFEHADATMINRSAP